jgi:PKD repeat protein
MSPRHIFNKILSQTKRAQKGSETTSAQTGIRERKGFRRLTQLGLPVLVAAVLVGLLPALANNQIVQAQTTNDRCDPESTLLKSISPTVKTTSGPNGVQYESWFEFAPVAGIKTYVLTVIEFTPDVIPPVKGKTHSLNLDNPPTGTNQSIMRLNSAGNIAVINHYGGGDPVALPTQVAKIAAYYASITGRAEVRCVPPVNAAPIAQFTATKDLDDPLLYTFENLSTDRDEPRDRLKLAWDFGVEGATSTEQKPSYRFSKAGPYTVSLKVTDSGGLTDTESKSVRAGNEELVGNFFNLSTTQGSTLRQDEPAQIRLRVQNLGEVALSDVVINSVAVVATDTKLEGAATLTPSVIVDARRLKGTLLTTGLGAQDFADFDLKPTKAGTVQISANVSAKKPDGKAVSAVVTWDVIIRPTPLTVELSAKVAGGPPREAGLALSFPLNKDKTKNKFVVDLKVTNNDDAEITLVQFADPAKPIDLKSLRVDAKGNPLPGVALELLTTPVPALENVTLAPKASLTRSFQYDTLDAAKVELSSRVTGVFKGLNISGLGMVEVSATSNEKLEFTSKLLVPAAGLLPAGLRIRLSGTIKNLSNTDTLIVGPPLPTVSGNASQIYYYALGPEFGEPVPVEIPELITLGPLEGRSYSVEIPTGQSDPRRLGNSRGGTRATLTFTPWAAMRETDGSETQITADQIKAKAEELERVVSIDDSIELPEYSAKVALANITVGGLEGSWNFVRSIPGLITGLVVLPYSALTAIATYQSTVWENMTPEERDLMAGSTSYLVVGTLLKNAEFGLRNSAELYKQVNQVALSSMTEMSNEWEIGDYGSVARKVTAIEAELVAGVAFPAMLGKLLASPVAEAAIARASARAQAEMAPVLARLNALSLIGYEEVTQAIGSITPGTKLGTRLTEKLFGISAEEASELVAIAKEFDVLLYFRSRHASSLEWLAKWKAVLKPEALKIKCVSEIDEFLGYKVTDIGRLIFKKPLALIENEKTGKSVQVWFDEAMASKGIAPGDPKYNESLGRMNDRLKEWATHEAEYKHWDKIKRINIGFNYSDNAIVGQGTQYKLTKYRGFRLTKVAGAEEEFIVEMTNSKGLFKSITGDIDGVMYTNLDGTPLSVEKHYALIERLRLSTRINAQHPETATYIKGSVEMIEKLLKGEQAILFTPFDKGIVAKYIFKKSKLNGPRDYYLHFEGAPVHVGGVRPAGPINVKPLEPILQKVPLVRKPPVPLTTAEKNARLGRCVIRRVPASSAAAGSPIRLTDDGVIEQYGPSTGNVKSSWAPTNHADHCLSEGPEVDLDLVASVVTSSEAAAGDNKVSIEVPDDGEPNAGFGIGDLIMLDPGGPNEETATVSGFGSLIFARPLKNSHAAGEMIVVLVSATIGTPTISPPTTVLGTTTTSVPVPSAQVFPALTPVVTTTASLASTAVPTTTGLTVSLAPTTGPANIPAASATATTLASDIGQLLPIAAPSASPSLTENVQLGEPLSYTGSDFQAELAFGLLIVAIGLLLQRKSREQVVARAHHDHMS